MKPLTVHSSAKPIGIWIRVSTEEQASGDSPRHHEERARKYAEIHGWEVREIYDLAGTSGKTVMEHPEARRMLADIKRGHIKALIFSKLARLARNTRELLDFSDLFREAGADMVSIQENIDTSTPAGRLFYTMVAAMAQWEREEIGERVRASIGVRAQLGKPLNGSAPYGYGWIASEGAGGRKSLQVVPEEAAIARRVFELFVEHRRKGAVARLLNEAGYRTREGGQWYDATVSRVLRNPCAKGTYVYNISRKTGDWKSEEKPEDQWSRLAVEPIVSIEVWDQANRILEAQEKRPARMGKTPVRPFSGVTFCKCGQKMYIPTGSRKYMCYTKGKRICRTSIDAETLDAIFCDQLKAYFVAPDRIEAHIAKARAGMAEREARLGAHRNEVEKVRANMAKTHQLYLDGQIPREGFSTFYRPLEERLRQLQDELPRVEAEVAHLKVTSLSGEEVVNEAKSLYSRWPGMENEEKIRIIQSIIERITVGDGKIEISLSHLPSSEELTKSQQLL